MELTKQDKKHIKEQVRKLSFRIVDEGKEYARLYEKRYYEEIINLCQELIAGIDAFSDQMDKMSNID